MLLVEQVGFWRVSEQVYFIKSDYFQMHIHAGVIHVITRIILQFRVILVLRVSLQIAF